MRRALLHFVLAAGLWAPWGPFSPAHAQSAGEASVKAAFLAKFAGFIEWPQGAFARPDSPLVIAVSRADDVAAELEHLTAGRFFDQHPIVVRRVPQGPPPPGAHIVYFGPRADGRLRELVAAVPPATLIVSDEAGGLAAGAMLNFMPDAGRVRFSASPAAAEARGLRLSARLLAVAQSIEGNRR